VALPEPPGAEHVVRSGRSRPSHRPELALVPERLDVASVSCLHAQASNYTIEVPRKSAVRHGGEPCRLWDSSAPGAASAAVLDTSRNYIACACNMLYLEVTLSVSSAVPALPVFRWTD
jgi:hypothetical protein